MIKAIILVGGEGTRLRPLTLEIPKPIVPLVNRPFLSYQIDLIKRHGIRDIIFAVNARMKSIRRVFGNGSSLGVRITYALEREPLGTGGAIKNAERYIDEAAVIFNGDILTDLDLTALLRFHHQRRARATLALTEVEDPTIYGVVETAANGRIRRFLEKPSWAEVKSRWISAGNYVFDREVFSLIPAGRSHSVERELFPLLLEQRVPFYAYKSRAYWMDIGTPRKYLQAHFDILEGNVTTPYEGKISGSRALLLGRRTRLAGGGKDVHLTGPLVIGDSCRVARGARLQHSVLGRACDIGEEAVLENCVLWDKVRIQRGAVLKGCIVGRKSVIGAHAELRDGTVLGAKCKVTPYSKL